MDRRYGKRPGYLAGLAGGLAICVGFFSGSPAAVADGFPFIQRGRTAADAVALEHAAKRLAAQQAGADTPLVGAKPEILPPDEVRIRARLHRLGQSIEQYKELARRQAGYQALQQEFRRLTHSFAEVSAMAEQPDSPLRQGTMRENWFQLQQAYDQAYFDLYGFDALDPYFGRHPDFAAWPDNYFHPREYWQRPGPRVPAYQRFVEETQRPPLRAPAADRRWEDAGWAEEAEWEEEAQWQPQPPRPQPQAPTPSPSPNPGQQF